MIRRRTQIGNGLEFDGVDDYVQIPAYTGGNQITVDIIFLKIASGTGFSCLYFIGNQSTFNQEYFFLAIREATNRVLLYVSDDSGNITSINGPVIALNEINSVTASVDYSAKTMSLYVNGDLIGSDTLGAGTHTIALTPSSIGRASYNIAKPMYYLKGRIYRASVYDKILSSGEVSSLHNGILPFSPYAIYKFNKRQGLDVHDSSGNGNHGTINGFSTATTEYGGGAWVDEKGETAK